MKNSEDELLRSISTFFQNREYYTDPQHVPFSVYKELKNANLLTEAEETALRQVDSGETPLEENTALLRAAFKKALSNLQ